MLTRAAFGLSPDLLPSRTDPAFALTAQNARAPAYGLHIALTGWIVGMVQVAACFICRYRRFKGKIRPGDPSGQ